MSARRHSENVFRKALAYTLRDPLQRRENVKVHIFYHPPVLILISALAEGPRIVEDCTLAAEKLMLAAYAAGLGTCSIG